MATVLPKVPNENVAFSLKGLYFLSETSLKKRHTARCFRELCAEQKQGSEDAWVQPIWQKSQTKSEPMQVKPANAKKVAGLTKSHVSPLVPCCRENYKRNIISRVNLHFCVNFANSAKCCQWQCKKSFRKFWNTRLSSALVRSSSY